MISTRKVIASFEVASIEEDAISGQRSLHAAKDFAQGEIISFFSAAEELIMPTYLTVQKDDKLHITLSPLFLQYVNHSCSPSAFFNTTLMQFVALKEVAAGDELTFFYPSTEWKMSQVFQCRCGCNNCLGTIKGAAFLPREVLEHYRLTDFIRRKLNELAKRA